MKHYRCHKTVFAFKITSIVPQDPTSLTSNYQLIGDDGAVVVDPDWMAKHSPYVGGYFVEYSDRYQSFSPPDVFEAGYSEIP